MKKKFFSLLLPILVLPLLTNCVASEQDVKSLDLRLTSVDNRLQVAENTLGELQKQQSGTVQSLQVRQAEAGNQADQLNTELRKLKGKLDESAFQYKTLYQQDDLMKKQFAASLAALQDKVDALTTKVEQSSGQLQTTTQDLDQAKADLAATEKQLNDLRASQAKEAADRALAAAAAAEQARKKAEEVSRHREITPAKVKKRPEAEAAAKRKKPTKAVQPKTSEPKEYRNARDLFQRKDYKKAYDAFNSFIKNNPKSKLDANARFWMGDCLYNQKQYAVAILEYQKVISDYKDTSKAPAALLKQALAFEKLKDKDTAKIIYQKIIHDYPGSEQAKVAKKKL